MRLWMRGWIVGLLVALSISGCADPAATVPGSKFNAVGQVADANGVGIAGISVVLEGGKSGETLSDNNGNFAFNNLADGTYTVIPSHTDTTFNPPHKKFTVKGADVEVDFAGSFSISGYVLDDTQKSIMGATVTLNSGSLISGAGISVNSSSSKSITISEADGKYTFTGLPNGSYSISSNQVGFGFAPA